jgi:nucleoside phosphorylase
MFEARPVIRALSCQLTADSCQPSRLYQADVNGQKVFLIISGVGQEPARQASYKLCDAGIKELVSVGYCGALTPELRVGDLITDRISTSKVPVWGREGRLALAAKASAQAVDMETQAIIEAGTRRGVPIRILRVVSDQLGDDVSPLLGESPTFSPWRIALRLLNPANWPYALKMWRQSRIASERLVQAVQAYLKGA